MKMFMLLAALTVALAGCPDQTADAGPVVVVDAGASVVNDVVNEDANPFGL